MKPHLYREFWWYDNKAYWICSGDAVNAYADTIADAYDMWARGKAKKDAFNRGIGNETDRD
jgi:hypothetical protein